MDRAAYITKDLTYITFNQDSSRFCIGTADGFRIFKTYPFHYSYRRDLNGGFKIIEMLNKSSLVALVGNGNDPSFPCNKVIFWDDQLARPRGEIPLNHDICALKMKRDFVFIATEYSIHVYVTDSLDYRDFLETRNNLTGILSVSYSSDKTILAYPAVRKGVVGIINYYTEHKFTIKAHKTAIVSLALNHDGSLLATGSNVGTKIKIFSTEDRTLLKIVRRGVDRAVITNLCFDPHSQWLVCCCDKGTLHMFSITTNQTTDDRRVWKRVMRSVLQNQTHFDRLHLSDAKTICCFLEGNRVIALNASGEYFEITFNPKSPGNMTVVNSQKFVDIDN